METSSRRKACDTCFKKKLRCDMLKPACSNCLLYNVRCSTTAIRRRAAPNAAPTVAAAANIVTPVETPRASSAIDGDSIEARLTRIEAKLDKLGDTGNAMPLEQQLSSMLNQNMGAAISSCGPPSSLTGLDVSGLHEEHSIPPLTEILPVVEDYFRDFNFALPLFRQQDFMRMLYEFYSVKERTKKSGAIWAAINVVLAIGYRTRNIETNDIAVRFDDRKVRKCIDNAQKELDGIVTCEEDILGVQVLLGLVILFQTNTDQKPASVLIGTAIRLAHRMSLHVKSSASQFPPEIARHRSNIFWICYSLDKDVSLRGRIPSIQNDEDVDLDLPETELADETNYLSAVNGCAEFNYLRARVQLAYLEGKIYDCLLSNRSMKLSQEAREERVSHLSRLLDQWLQAMPVSLRLESITRTLEMAPLTHIIFLYHTYLMCSTTLLGLYSYDAPWIKAISKSSSEALHHFDKQTHVCMKRHHPALPGSWALCVGISRECLKLLGTESYSGCNLWLNSCAYISTFVVLLANIIYFPFHELADYDRRLTSRTMGRMEKLLEYTTSTTYQNLHEVLVGLEQAADFAANRAKSVATMQELAPPVPQSQYTSYPSTPFGVFSDYITQVPIAQPEVSGIDSAWLHASTLDASGVDLTGFDLNEGISSPSFMQDFYD
ncbi:hypothetical protein GGR53DRAFT_123670 [Hypoxylon sp. FL1150]|nr:hypothetical protein GGR53DRAFT_123670 [Hypoxylon sp. FL1150]